MAPIYIELSKNKSTPNILYAYFRGITILSLLFQNRSFCRQMKFLEMWNSKTKSYKDAYKDH